jgi:hypothetical protein
MPSWRKPALLSGDEVSAITRTELGVNWAKR